LKGRFRHLTTFDYPATKFKSTTIRIGAPWHWYKLDARPSLELLETFVRRNETPIQASLGDLEQSKALKNS
jgi:hypothetical protein